MARLYEPTAGEVHFEGRSLQNGRGDGLYRPGGESNGAYPGSLLPPDAGDLQNPYSSLNPRKTVRDILTTPLVHRGMKSMAQREEEVARFWTMWA